MTVVHARIFLSFVERAASTAAYTIVVPPTILSVHCHSGVPPRTGLSRASRNTPAFTIVEECRYADTGAGASIAPGSQK